MCLASGAGGGYTAALSRSVAQPGRALCSGRRGRRFESSHSDQKYQRVRRKYPPKDTVSARSSEHTTDLPPTQKCGMAVIFSGLPIAKRWFRLAIMCARCDIRS